MNINLWEIPKDLLEYINCDKLYIGNYKIESIYWFRNHVRVSAKNTGELRFFKKDHPNIDLHFI